MDWTREGFLLTDDSAAIKPEDVKGLLIYSYWAPERPTELIEISMKSSLNFGLFFEDQLIGFARVITDRVIFSYLCDVIISEAFRGHGLGQWMLQCIIEHPEIKATRQMLFTKDAQGFYGKFGFKVRESMFREGRSFG